MILNVAVETQVAGVDRKGLAAHDPFLHAARDHGLEQLAQGIALAKTAVAVLIKFQPSVNY